MLAILSLGMLLIAAIVPPISQPPEYHQFADKRSYFGIPNFFNVVSNLALLFVGIAGLIFLLFSRISSIYSSFSEPCERGPYLILFLSVAMAGVWHRRPRRCDQRHQRSKCGEVCLSRFRRFRAITSDHGDLFPSPFPCIVLRSSDRRTRPVFIFYSSAFHQFVTKLS